MFAHLHQHTTYSLLDGAARIKELIDWVKRVSPEKPTIAMTDHGNMHGAIEFYRAAVAAEVKPIIGYEAYVTPGSRFDRRPARADLDGGNFHLTLLAKNFTGYQNLSKLASRAYLEGFYGKPRVDHEILKEHSEGIIALSGCLGAEIPRAILDRSEAAGEEMLNRYLEIYGDNFFMEIQNHGLEDQYHLNQVLKGFAHKYGIGMAATNDGHYITQEDAKAHDVLLAIQTKRKVTDENRFKFPCEEFFVKSPEEMAVAVPESEFEGALANTMHIADMCNLELPIGKKRVYQMPIVDLPQGITEAEQLRIDSYQGLMRHYDEVTEDVYREYLSFVPTDQRPANIDALSFDEVLLAIARAGQRGHVEAVGDQPFGTFEYPHLEAFVESIGEGRLATIIERVEYELGVVIAMGFPDYLLIVSDFINWARDNDIAVGPGRGSGAGSIVCYALRITNIDPLHYGLLFERFLNPERVSMPDIDIDFSDRRREEVIDYVRQKYGDEKVAHIATFGTMASRAALRDAARAMDFPVSEAGRVAKLVPIVRGRSMSISETLRTNTEFQAAYSAGSRDFVDVAMSLEGLTRHASVHAAGVIISRDPIQELAPVFRQGDGPIVAQYDMKSVEDLGFIKMDFLGLRTLSLIEVAVQIIRETRGIDLDPDAFPVDDEKTFELLSRGEAAGVFQFESGGMVDTLKRLKPHRIQDLIAVTSLYRPGPMENIPTYIRRHHGTEEVNYDEFPESEEMLAPILEETYGIPVYQEQIMEIAREVAGYSLGQADLLRRAMGKKDHEEMTNQRMVFIDGAKEQHNISTAEASRIFDLLAKFADYGFNKSHAAAYSVISYQTAYLKANYPVEFMAALLTVESGDSDKVRHYVEDANHLGIDVLPPDVNESGGDFTPVGDVVRFGLYGLKNLGRVPVDALREERKNGPYKDIFDLCKRVDSSLLNRRGLESMIKAGAFDSFFGDDPGKRSALLEVVEPALKWGQLQREQEQAGQFSLFGPVAETTPDIPDTEPLPELTKLLYERESLGLYLSGHPLNHYPGLAAAASCRIGDLPAVFARDRNPNGRLRLALAGLTEGVRKTPIRSGMMAKFELSDDSGSQELLVFNRNYDDVAPLLEDDVPGVAIVDISEGDEGDLRVIVDSFIRWDQREGSQPLAVVSFKADEANFQQLQGALDHASGRTPVRFDVLVPEGVVEYQPDKIRVDLDALTELESTCPWLQVSTTIDTRALLARRPVNPWQRRQGGEPERRRSNLPF